MKAGWESTTVGKLSEVVTKGTTPTSVGHKFIETGINFIKVESLSEHGQFIASKLAHISEDCHEALKRSQIKEGDILFSIAGALGRTAVVPADIVPANTNQALSIIRLKDDAPIHRPFLVYALSSGMLIEQIEKARGGVAQQNLSLAQVKAFNIPLPPIQEQQRIVAVLDEAFEGLARARAHAEANLQNARELFALAFEHELLKHKDTSTKTTIGEVCTGFEYGTSAKSQTEGKMPVLRMGNLQSGEIDWGDLVYTDSDVDIEKLKLNDGDVLFNRTNSLEHVGKTAIYRGDMPAIFAGYLIRVHHDRRTLLPEFLNMFLNSKSAREYGRSISGKSVNQANISASKLKTYPIILPSVEVQEEIVERMERLRGPLKDLESSYEVKIQDTDDLRKSLLQKAFAGELT